MLRPANFIPHVRPVEYITHAIAYSIEVVVEAAMLDVETNVAIEEVIEDTIMESNAIVDAIEEAIEEHRADIEAIDQVNFAMHTP